MSEWVTDHGYIDAESGSSIVGDICRICQKSPNVHTTTDDPYWAGPMVHNAALATAQQQVRDLRAALEAVQYGSLIHLEFSDMTAEYGCFECEALEGSPHTDTCIVGRALAATAEPEAER